MSSADELFGTNPKIVRQRRTTGRIVRERRTPVRNAIRDVLGNVLTQARRRLSVSGEFNR